MPAEPPDRAYQTAARLYAAGQLQHAKKVCEHILRQQPLDADALHLLGVITARIGPTQPAIDLIRRAIAQRPKWPQAQYHLGNLLQITGQLNSAIECYQQAIQLQPDYLQACNNLGIALRESNRLDEAVAVFESALVHHPDDPVAQINLANVLKDKGELDRSVTLYRRALAAQPGSPEAANNLGVVLQQLGQLEQSRAAYQQALTLRPDFTQALSNLGSLLEQTGQLDDGLLALSKAIAISPADARAHYNLANVLKTRGQITQSIAAYRRALAIKPDFVEAHTNLVYAMHFHPDYDQSVIAEELRRWNQQHAAAINRLPAVQRNTDPNRRLRIGYVSPDFKEHPIGRFLLPLLAHHDKTRFEIFAYSQVPVADAVTDKLRSCVDTWRDITAIPDAPLAELIRRDQIDILIDLTMHMARNRLLVFARKPAPVQITWLAYCSSTGLDAMDFRLSDPYLDPPEIDDLIYTEKTIRLAHTYWCFQPTADLPVADAPARINGHITFGCLNNVAKISEPVIAAWIQLLQSLPGARLLLHSPVGSHRQDMLVRFQSAGIDPARIRFVGKLPFRQYLLLYNQIDIDLDTFPYTGGTTSCDALWMGVPVITLSGKTAVGRSGVSLLSNLGLPELIADSVQRYIQLATELATNLPRLEQLRSTLRRRMEQSALMDAPAFARQVEAGYSLALKIHSPQSFAEFHRENSEK